MTVVVRHLFAQPAPQRFDRHEILKTRRSNLTLRKAQDMPIPDPTENCVSGTNQKQGRLNILGSARADPAATRPGHHRRVRPARQPSRDGQSWIRTPCPRKPARNPPCEARPSARQCLVPAMQQNQSTDPVRYLAAEARDLGIIKRKRKPPRQNIQAPSLSA